MTGDLLTLLQEEATLLAEERAAATRREEKRAEIRTIRDEIQAEALRDPQPGDRWHEMLSYWLYVVDREGDLVTVQYCGAPCTFPGDATEETLSVAEWREKSPGWVDALLDRGHDVTTWRGRAKGAERP
ncbi:MAG TPA: hypothetical protein VGP44_04415 [Gemmatimonadales bacterium]|nr:hypothetical protein [Gemmatimonadales bacterium]